MTNDEIVILVGQIVQTELNKRYTELLDEVKELPYSETKVVQFSSVNYVLINNFTYNVQMAVKKALTETNL